VAGEFWIMASVTAFKKKIDRRHVPEVMDAEVFGFRPGCKQLFEQVANVRLVSGEDLLLFA
jgi:hypothetical protein